MTDKVFIDSNVLIYLFDLSEPEKREIAKNLILNLLITDKPNISLQVVNEFISATTKKVKNIIPLELVENHVKFLEENFVINPINLRLCYKAIKIQQRYKYSYYDSLIIATALENNCSILYSEDMQGGQIIEGKLKIVNPFK